MKKIDFKTKKFNKKFKIKFRKICLKKIIFIIFNF